MKLVIPCQIGNCMLLDWLYSTIYMVMLLETVLSLVFTVIATVQDAGCPGRA